MATPNTPTTREVNHMDRDWQSLKRSARGRCPVCGKKTGIKILVQARESTFNSRALAGRSVALCEQHAMELFARLAEQVDNTRSN